MEILSSEQMRSADRDAIEVLGIPSLELMESAGSAIAAALLDDDPRLRLRSVVAVCGKGNNGGDGLVVLRRLATRGLRVSGILLADPEGLSPDSATNYRRAVECGIELVVAGDETRARRAIAAIPRDALVLDCLLGTGIRGAVRGLAAAAIAQLNGSGLEIVAIDLPSGLDANSAHVAGAAIEARRTYTLCRPKPALLFEPAAAHAGHWRALPIGIPDEIVAQQGSRMIWQDAASLRGLLPPRAIDAHKGKLGHVLVVGGSPGQAGAAVLAARGALRSGAGLVTVASPASVRAEIAVQQAELMTEPLAETTEGKLAAGAAARVQDLLGTRDTLVIGPGLGTDPGTAKAVRLLAISARRGAVIDADGLNALAAEGGALLTLREASAPRILTPHPGEAARLLGVTTQEVQADRRAAVTTLAERSGATVVLKGFRSLIARPDGWVAVNSTGNPGMATAGSGDVLTGILAALLARGIEPFDAARLAVFLHGDAGDRAAHRCGQDALIASDLLESLGAAFGAQCSPAEGYA